MPDEGKTHLLLFLENYLGRDRRMGLGFVWLATIWFIWQTRNKVIFNGADVELSLALDSIQFKSWIWLKGRIKDFRFTLYEWISNPMVCLDTL